MAKRISEKQKIAILEDFINKKSIDEISEKFNFTKLTISRNLKKSLGEEEYKELVIRNESKSSSLIKKEKLGNNQIKDDLQKYVTHNDIFNQPDADASRKKLIQIAEQYGVTEKELDLYAKYDIADIYGMKAFYLPKGKALWAARQTSNLADNISNAPILGISGGFY